MSSRAPRLLWSVLAGAVAAGAAGTVALRGCGDPAPGGSEPRARVVKAGGSHARPGERRADAALSPATDPFASEEAMRAHGYIPAREVTPPPAPPPRDPPPVREPAE